MRESFDALIAFTFSFGVLDVRRASTALYCRLRVLQLEVVMKNRQNRGRAINWWARLGSIRLAGSFKASDASSPHPRKRRTSGVSLLPSGPGPVPPANAGDIPSGKPPATADPPGRRLYGVRDRRYPFDGPSLGFGPRISTVSGYRGRRTPRPSPPFIDCASGNITLCLGRRNYAAPLHPAYLCLTFYDYLVRYYLPNRAAIRHPDLFRSNSPAPAAPEQQNFPRIDLFEV